MKNKFCEMEQRVLEGLKKGILAMDLKQHIAGCPVCRDLSLVYRWMGEFNDVSLKFHGDISLPKADQTWETAFTPPKRIDRALVKKALRPLLIPQLLTYIVAAVVFGMVLFGDNPAVKKFLDDYLDLGFLAGFFSNFFRFSAFVTVPFILVTVFMMIYFLFAVVTPRKT